MRLYSNRILVSYGNCGGLMEESSNAGSRSVRALELLEYVSSVDRPVSASDIEHASDLPKATVHRLCNLLLDEGYLRRDIAGRGYEPGERLARLALQSLSNQRSQSESHAILEAVAAEIGETCNIAIPAATSMLYLDRVEAEWPLRIQLPTGSNVPLHCTASGKLYLANISPAKRERLISKLPLESKAPNTITDKAALTKALEKIYHDGFGTDNEEFIPGMVAVAVPIRNESGKLMATMATHGPVVRMSFETALGHVEKLQRAAREIAKGLRL